MIAVPAGARVHAIVDAAASVNPERARPPTVSDDHATTAEATAVPNDEATTTAVPAEGIVRGIVRAIEPGPVPGRPGTPAAEHGRIVLHLAHTDYDLHLALAVPASRIEVPVGKRIRGVIEASAMRIHPAHGGGRFIEPVVGEPRIVAGTVEAIDEAANRVLVESAAPLWLSMMQIQDRSVVEAGGLVNCHVRDVRFRPLG